VEPERLFEVYHLSNDERRIIQLGLSGKDKLHYFTDYFFRRDDDSGFQFDFGFDPAWAWQHKLVFARQSLIVAICGIGTGKTLGVGMAGATWSVTTEGFKFMNGAGWAYQAKLMWQLIIEQLADTRAEKFISNVVESPYPKIEFTFGIGRSKSKSSMEFMSMDQNAQKIFSWRGDWINLDEAALIDNLDIAMQNLATRLTGKTARGREYLGRFSLMSNAWDNESSAHLYYFYDLALDNPNECLSISIPTSANHNVTQRQTNNILRFIRDKEEQERMLEGKRPEGKGIYFSRERVNACADDYLNEYLSTRVDQNEPGFDTIRVPTFDLVSYSMKPKPGSYTFLLGDPGSDNYPSRNSPCIGVIDAYNFPIEPATLLAFWWGMGNGKIQPFVDQFYSWQKRFRPIFSGVDSTGPQKGMVEVLNLSVLWNDIPAAGERDSIYGLDFSGSKKPMYLVALRNLIEMGLLVWPSAARGIKMQLLNYDPTKDRYGQQKIAQDIVAMLAMAAHVLRVYFGLDAMAENREEARQETLPYGPTAERYRRIPTEERTIRST
jgi:hypothetical protein